MTYQVFVPVQNPANLDEWLVRGPFGAGTVKWIEPYGACLVAGTEYKATHLARILNDARHLGAESVRRPILEALGLRSAGP